MWTREVFIAETRRIQFGFVIDDTGEDEKIKVVKVDGDGHQKISEDEFSILQNALTHVEGRVRKPPAHIYYGTSDTSILSPEQLRS